MSKVIPIMEKDNICSFFVGLPFREIQRHPDSILKEGGLSFSSAETKILRGKDSSLDDLVDKYDYSGEADVAIALPKSEKVLPYTKLSFKDLLYTMRVYKNKSIVKLYSDIFNHVRRGEDYCNVEHKPIALSSIEYDKDEIEEYLKFVCGLQHLNSEDRVNAIADMKDFRNTLDIAIFLKELKEEGLVINSQGAIKEATRNLPVNLSNIDLYEYIARENTISIPTLRTILEVTYPEEENKFTSRGYYIRHKGN